MGDEWGYIDETGMFAVAPQFADVTPFVLPDATFAQSADGQYALINRKGAPIGPGRFDDAGDFAEGLARVEAKGKVGFADGTGAVVIPLQFVPDPNGPEDVRSAR